MEKYRKLREIFIKIIFQIVVFDLQLVFVLLHTFLATIISGRQCLYTNGSTSLFILIYLLLTAFIV